MVQYEQCEQEMKHLQQLIEAAHREIEDKPVATSNIQELQAQISRHEVRQKGGQGKSTDSWKLASLSGWQGSTPCPVVGGGLFGSCAALWLALYFKGYSITQEFPCIPQPL